MVNGIDQKGTRGGHILCFECVAGLVLFVDGQLSTDDRVLAEHNERHRKNYAEKPMEVRQRPPFWTCDSGFNVQSSSSDHRGYVRGLQLQLETVFYIHTDRPKPRCARCPVCVEMGREGTLDPKLGIKNPLQLPHWDCDVCTARSACNDTTVKRFRCMHPGCDWDVCGKCLRGAQRILAPASFDAATVVASLAKPSAARRVSIHSAAAAAGAAAVPPTAVPVGAPGPVEPGRRSLPDAQPVRRSPHEVKRPVPEVAMGGQVSFKHLVYYFHQ